MNDINLKEELDKAQVEFKQHQLLKDVHQILKAQSGMEKRIEARIRSLESDFQHQFIESNQLDESRVFNIQAIETLCVKFRLRFLESSLFKDEIPAEAIRVTKRLESATGMRFKSFRIIAPAQRFKLKDSTDDPVLLAELPDGRYYYIFQWGNDLKWYQHLLKYPFRHMGSLALTSVTIGALVAWVMPEQFSDGKAEFFYRFFMFSMSSALVMTLSIILGIMYSKDFSENVWNSRFEK